VSKSEVLFGEVPIEELELALKKLEMRIGGEASYIG